MRREVVAVDAEARNWAMAAHLTAIAGALFAGIGSWVGPLVIWLLKKDQDPFVAEHAKEALNVNLALLVLSAIAFAVVIVTVGIGALLVVPLGIVVGIVWLVFTVQAAIQASNGRPYRYPLSIRFIS